MSYFKKAGMLLGLSALASLSFAGGNNPGKTVSRDVVRAHMDTSVRPGDDFFRYANGGWIRNNPIPAEETSWGIGHLVQEELYERKRLINEAAVKKQRPKGADQQIADFWFSGMDTASIEKQGLKPLKQHLDRIAALSSTKALMSEAARLHTYGVGVFFSEGVSQDAMKSSEMAYYMYQGGLGMPNRDYYFNTDARTTKVREAYPHYIARIFSLMGYDQATARSKAAAVLSLETRLADSSRRLEELRDPYANYNKMAIASLPALSGGMDWPLHLREMGVHSIDSVIIGQPGFFRQLGLVLAQTPMQTLKDYMAFHLLRSFTPYLSQAFVDAGFDFYSKTIRGAQAQRPRWKRVLDAEEDAMGEALGQLFAREYFNATAKARYTRMVEHVRGAYKARLEQLDWMSDSTRQKALAKLASMTSKVGYPDKWKDFSGLQIDRGPYVLNMMRANAWWNNYYMQKLGKPVDRNEWEMTPQTYNAYYNPSNNEIVLPAGIFTVPGFRDEELDDAVVYGYAAASTIGHEITHGFDDEGRQFDAAGNLNNWWSGADEAQFASRAEVLVEQFNNMVAVDTMRLNGRASLGENLADLGGVLLGLDAFRQTEAYQQGTVINGLSPVQRYFLGYALGWMYDIRKEQLASQVLTDVHAPAKFRVNGPLPNVPEFYEAFGIRPGDPMYLPEDKRVKLW